MTTVLWLLLAVTTWSHICGAEIEPTAHLPRRDHAENAAVKEPSAQQQKEIELVNHQPVHILEPNESVRIKHDSRYHVFKMDWGGVEGPYIVSLWILIASIAKIGNYHILYEPHSSPFPILASYPMPIWTRLSGRLNTPYRYVLVSGSQ